MATPAFRSGDSVACPKHGCGCGGSVPNTVMVGGAFLRRVGDFVQCGDGSVDALRSGASTVRLGGEYVGRAAERTGHGGVTVGGCSSVLIGSPSASGSLGGAKSLCESMAAGRHPPPGTLGPGKENQRKPLPPEGGGKGQSYNNCGIESMRQLLHQGNGAKLSEDELLEYMVQRHMNMRPTVLAGTEKPDLLDTTGRFHAGGSRADERAAGLTELGLPSEAVTQTPEAIQQAVESGRGVGVSVWAGTLWGPNQGFKPGTGAHAILVTGLERDANGKVVTYIINDTGTGACGQRVPASTFEAALNENGLIVRTIQPIW